MSKEINGCTWTKNESIVHEKFKYFIKNNKKNNKKTRTKLKLK